MTTKLVEVTFEISNTLSFTEVVEVDEDADEDEIAEAAEKYSEMLNWGDLDQMFNLTGPPEFNIDLYDVDDGEPTLKLGGHYGLTSCE